MAYVNNYKSPFRELETLEEGESIEQKVRRITQTGEKIDDSAPEIFTERKDGVLPQYDIRTDRFDVALEAMDKVNKSNIAKRDAKLEMPKEPEVEPKNE